MSEQKDLHVIGKRPSDVNDLQIMWAIRDIPSEILEFKYKGFLLLLLSIIGNNNCCYYSQPQLAKICGMSERHLINILQYLKESKFIHVIAPEKKGRGYANEYYLNYELILNHQKTAKIKVHSLQASNKKGAQFACLSKESLQNTSKKGAQFAPQDIQQDIQQKQRKSFYKAEQEKNRQSVLPNGQKHAFAESMNQMASEQKSIDENEKNKYTPMPDSLRQLFRRGARAISEVEEDEKTKSVDALKMLSKKLGLTDKLNH